tara:strand:+ start:1086 stop:1832 length:747 start_codon:yes stop_codon:yes gene_type:complete
MAKYLTNNFSVINIHKKPSLKSEVVTQMIYGDRFSIFKRSRKWLKIKIKEDGYNGYIKNKKFSNFLKPTHKISVLKSKVYKLPNKRKKIYEISFGSKVKIFDGKAKFFRFSKGWISKDDVKPIKYKEKNPFRKIGIFKNVKYKWGGKSFKGIDCSALVQICLNYNNIFCPRDTKDQLKYFKKNISLKQIKKNDIIFWKGHVAVAISKKQLIHAYGPLKKTVIMNIKKTIKKIKKTANLEVKSIKRIRN